jgi:hypothetical protein
MKGKTKFANKFQMDLNNVNPNNGNLAKINSKYMHFIFFKIVKIEPANKVQSLFSE